MSIYHTITISSQEIAEFNKDGPMEREVKKMWERCIVQISEYT